MKIKGDKFEQAKKDHLFLNDITEPTARLFIIAMFHEIEHQADIIENLHYKIKTLEVYHGVKNA